MKHKHHIIPKHIGGTDNPDNLIELSVEEHAKAHKALWEKHGRFQDYYAWQGLSGLIPKQHLLKEIMNCPEIKSHLSKKGKEFWNKLTPSEKDFILKKFNQSKIGNKNALGHKHPHSDEAKEKISKAKSGVPKTEEFRKKMSIQRTGTGNPNYGRKNTPETIEKMRQSAKRRWQLSLLEV